MTILFLICFVLVLPCLIAAACSTLLFWYEALNNPCEEIPAPAPGVMNCFMVFSRALSGYAMYLVMYPFGWAVSRSDHSPLQAETGLSRPPVVLIHGVYHNSSAWVLFKRKLEKAGYRVSTYSYHSFFTSFETILKGLDDHIHLVEASFPDQKPVLIGHSLGGIFIRSWLANPENHTRASGVVTLGTPHRGSGLAPLAFGRLVKEIIPHSPRLAALNALPVPGSIPCVSICSPTDEMVVPACSLLPPAGWTMSLTRPVSHFGLLVRPGVAKTVVEEMEAMLARRERA